MNQEKKALHFGLESEAHAIKIATDVCDALGYGNSNLAINLLLETACAESSLGHCNASPTGGAGFGLMQTDIIGIKAVLRLISYRDVQIIRNCFGFDIRDTHPMQLEENPVHAFVLTRMTYKLIDKPIPAELDARALYWKTYQGFACGKCNSQEYVNKSNFYLYAEANQ